MSNYLFNVYEEQPKKVCRYFRKVFFEVNTDVKSRGTFINRLRNPTIDDVLLFCHVCKVDEKEILKPLKAKFKNIPPYNSSLQLTIETDENR